MTLDRGLLWATLTPEERRVVNVWTEMYGFEDWRDVPLLRCLVEDSAVLRHSSGYGSLGAVRHRLQLSVEDLGGPEGDTRIVDALQRRLQRWQAAKTTKCRSTHRKAV